MYKEYKEKYPYPEIGDILISASGSIGRTVVYQGKDEYFQDSNIVWLKHGGQLNNNFLHQFYTIVKWKGLEGSTIKRLYNKNILDTSISIPSLPEQEQIGEFFKQLDNTIALHQRKIELLQQLKKARLENRLGDRLKHFTKYKVLIIDELGYLPIDKDDSKLFFQLIDLRYEKKSTIITTNINFNSWDDIFYDAVVANAILDRILHHSHVISISGKSYRLKDHMKPAED